MIRDGKEWKTVSWDSALTHVAEKMQAVLKEFGHIRLAQWSSQHICGRRFICQKLLHAIGCSNMDYRHHQIDTDYLDNRTDDTECNYLDFAEIDQAIGYS